MTTVDSIRKPVAIVIAGVQFWPWSSLANGSKYELLEQTCRHPVVAPHNSRSISPPWAVAPYHPLFRDEDSPTGAIGGMGWGRAGRGAGAGPAKLPDG
jgi:hypothetical protein